MFSQADIDAISARGSDPAVVEQQLKNFETGFPFLPIDRPATIGDGIMRLSDAEAARLDQQYDAYLGERTAVKFVPASGAASRMFKDLFAFVQDPGASLEGKPAQAWQHLRQFAFYEALMDEVPEGAENDPRAVFRTLLEDDGLGYGQLPKGLLAFHLYKNGPRTPVEEHLVEAAHYSKDSEGKARLHFTVSPEHRHGFMRLIERVVDTYQENYDVTYEIGFSEQKPHTDTIAVDMENGPFRLDDREILFRPGGHGALIENLNDLNADLVFIKNIDNVCPDRMKPDTYRYKRALGAVLLQTQQAVFALQERLEKGEAGNEEVETFVRETLCVELPENYVNFTPDEKTAYLRDRLDRPMRVCGMVKNEGEPGGGPYWTLMPDRSRSLQIVESAQMDEQDAGIKAKVAQATHFNPVDLVCAVRDRHGKKYDLTRFVDPRTGFITEKSLQGRALKAQELPGLWNGAMAHWNTLFVEVPITTFNPVKTINDLLRPQHQA